MKNKEMITFICVDDKAKVDYGKPNLAISSAVGGKKSIVPCTIQKDRSLLLSASK